ncbi:hypothetical protein HELRODRAFT_182551 [Helobdella robusta]|uniref:Dynein heavy chain linker domain-containing protein n=1 Tax=Helobdella robusta TaxID=6412 RepID=T1FIC3_HELRO|nr:hypothetical protein HELRODRAFT_182551 [Helobdella robusta]ESN90842.1 hypothetical protein HELRODRAFT_182551 [Helobdella robusta]
MPNLKDKKTCVTGRRKEITKELLANLPAVNKDDLINRIVVKPATNEDTEPDPSVVMAQQTYLHEVKKGRFESRQSSLPLLRSIRMRQEEEDSVKAAFRRAENDKSSQDFYGMTNIHDIIKTVPYQDIDKNDYCTVSKRGVMRVMMNEDSDYISLERFDEEFKYFQQLIKIRIFCMFRQWKSFSTWKKNVLRPALEKVRSICLKIDDLLLCRYKIGKLYTLSDFMEFQNTQLKSVVEKLLQYRDSMKRIVMNACKNVFSGANFSIDINKYYKDYSEHLKPSRYKDDVFVEPPEMTYTEQANKKELCRRLTNFIRLVDYLTVNTLHFLTLSSARSFLYQLIKCSHKTPAVQDIVSWLQIVDEAAKSSVNPDKMKKIFVMTHSEDGQSPIFVTEFVMMQQDKLAFDPDELAFQQAIELLITKFQETTLKPMINNKIEKRTCGDGPSLLSILEDNNYIKILFKSIIRTIAEVFEAAYTYADTFADFMQFYTENQDFNAEKLKQENKDVAYFQEALDRYHRQYRMIDVIQNKKSLGLILVDATNFKNQLIPSPLNCLDILHVILPWKARKEADRLTSELQDAEFNLEFQCSTTQDYVNQLVFLEQIQERTLFPSINTVYNCIDKSLGDRDKNVASFNVSLEKDIIELNKELKLLKQQSQNQAILDPDMNIAAVYDVLKALMDKLAELQHKASTFKGYQKSLKVAITKLEDLDDVNDELKLRQLLWDSIMQWDVLVQKWMEASLETLDAEELTSTTLKYLKIVNQLEKGLPPNGVVPKLKEQIEKMKVKLPMVTDLRNPTLKQRHWDAIEAVLEFSFTADEPLTLGKLDQIKAFKHSEAIQEISGQASSEASLESILKKMTLDDCNVNISTIASSHHAKPIKPKVDEWAKQLDIFGKTLEAWLSCQRSWIYFESIFSAPDIQRQLPAESKLFVTVDRSFKDIMRKVYKVPLAIRAGTQPGLLESLQNNNVLLEQIQKCLDAYLESKRVVFPR